MKLENQAKEKKCKLCEETKPTSEFSIRDGASDGYESACKICESARNKAKYRVIRAKRIKKNDNV